MSFLLRRGIFYILTLWAAVTMNFLIPRLMPGNPVEVALARFQGQLSPAATHSLAVAFGFTKHQTIWSQYFSYVNNTLHLNFGVSFTYFPTHVSTVIAASLPWTVVMVGLATVIGWVTGTLLGVLSGWFRGTWLDSLVPAGAMFRGIPTFWIGLILVTFFGLTLHLLPVGGGYSNSLTPAWSLAFVGSAVRHGILPALTIVIGSMAGNLVTMRNMMVTTLGEDYVLAAEAKGLPRRRVALGYAARNAVVPSVVAFALEVGFVVSGALLVEEVFAYPGIGYVLFQAVSNEDYPLMQAIFLIITLAVLLANALTDIVLVIIDPRYRQGSNK